jgi:arylsulfatase A-like enzyme
MVLVKQGMYDRTLLVVTADYGMSFRPGDYARRVATPASADLVPTLADLLGIRVPWRLDGVSQAGTVAPRTRTDKWFFSAPGRRQRFDSPENLARALRGLTDRLELLVVDTQGGQVRPLTVG